jgi:hypothetical protein
MSQIFDLKGSTFKRETLKGTKSKLSETLKDTDFIKLAKSKPLHINLSETTRKELLEIIDLDSQFLSENYLMDYSILLGVELADDRLDTRKRIKNRRVVES